MKISVIGCGYVGCVTGVCFADLGHDVVLVDVDRAKVNAINAGQSPVYEPGLDEQSPPIPAFQLPLVHAGVGDAADGVAVGGTVEVVRDLPVRAGLP